MNRQLTHMPGMDGILDRAHVALFPPGLRVNNPKIIEVPGGRWDEPLLYSEVIRINLLWRALLHGKAVLTARMEKPKVVVHRKAKKKAEKGVVLAEYLNNSARLNDDRFEIVYGKLTLSSVR